MNTFFYLVVDDFSVESPSSGYGMEEQKNFCVFVGTWDYILFVVFLKNSIY